jgi:cytochrome b subunit of formate dehydrogenase
MNMRWSRETGQAGTRSARSSRRALPQVSSFVRRTLAAAVLLSSAALTLSPPALSQDPPSDGVCVLCHDDVSTPALQAGEGDGLGFHDDVACVYCHKALMEFDPEELEHETPVPAATCTPCHDDVIDRVHQGAHESAGVTCAGCHGIHELRSFHGPDQALAFGRISALCTGCHIEIASAPPGDLHSHAFRGRTCLSCHDAHDNHSPRPHEADAACMMCHGDAEAAPDGSAPPAAVAASVHGHAGLACTLCHTDLEGVELPHEEEELQPVDCSHCHPAAADAYSKGVHAGDPGNGHQAASCTDCHGAHDVQPTDDPRSPVFALNLPGTCESCHQPSPTEAHPAPGGEKVKTYETSIHGRLLIEKGLVVSANCVSCHGSHEIHPGSDPESTTSRRNVPYTCGTCHAGMLSGYLAGVHGEDFVSGVEDVPVCTDCHSEHAIADPALGESSVSASHVAETCARCHADDELAQRYGFQATRMSSWGSSYHGIASGFGATGAANCASCHGFHAILPSSDPRSMVHPENLQATCGECHPNAGAAFAKVPVHSLVEREGNFIPWLVKVVYAVLVVGMIGAFLLFILIDLFARVRLRFGWGPRDHGHVDPREWPDEDRLVAPDETFKRMGKPERIQHGLLIVSFMLLVVTGLPVFLHQSEWMRSVIDLEGGFRLRSLLHRAGAIGLIGLSGWHVVTLLLIPKVRHWFTYVMIRPRDIIDFAQEVMFNLGIGPWLSRRKLLRPLFSRWPALACTERPKIGRYGLVEKLEYTAVLWGNIVMIATGAILWRPDWVLDWAPSWTFDVSRVIHGFEATLAFLAIIIWHMYHVHLRPEVFPMSRTFLNGRISREEMRHHHAAEYLRILEKRRRRARELQPSLAERETTRT